MLEKNNVSNEIKSSPNISHDLIISLLRPAIKSQGVQGLVNEDYLAQPILFIFRKKQSGH